MRGAAGLVAASRGCAMPTCNSPRTGTACWRCARIIGSDGEPARQHRAVAARCRRRPARRARSWSAGRISSRARVCRLTAAGWPGSSGIIRTCPGSARGCSRLGLSAPGGVVSAVRLVAALWPVPTGRRRCCSRLFLPTACCMRARTGMAGGTSTGFEVDTLVAVCPMQREIGVPPWVFGQRSYGFLPDGSLIAAVDRRGPDKRGAYPGW